VTTDEIGELQVTSSKLQVGAVTTEKIQNGAVTQEKLAPGAAGDRHILGTTQGEQSLEGLYLYNQSFPIDWTVADLSSWIPAGARWAIVQLGMFTQTIQPNVRAELRVRRDLAQREAICLANGTLEKTVWNQGLVPLTPGRTLEYQLTMTGPITVTIFISIVGYIL
jgi:hypothetical protein